MPAGVGQAVLEQPALAGDAHLAGAGALPRRGRLGERGPERAAQGGEEVNHALAVLRRQQKMQAGGLVGMLDNTLLQGLALVDKERVGQLASRTGSLRVVVQLVVLTSR